MSWNKKHRSEKYKYNPGLGNLHVTEAIPNTLPEGQNSPQQCKHGLYAEQVSGSPFTAPRVDNLKVWFYRTRPSVSHKAFKAATPNALLINDFSKCRPDPAQYRWMPFDLPSSNKTWVEGLATVCGAGDPSMKEGCAIHIYTANTNMDNKAFYNSDGEFLIVPQVGRLDIQTECGFLEVFPGEICVIPRGILFSVSLPDGPSRGYVIEVYNHHFRLPELGPIGANGLANPRDFKIPVAAFEDKKVPFTVTNKFLGELFEFEKDHSPFNVVGWHGNYYPYKYDLDDYCPVNAVVYDHPDPSIFTVLTCPTSVPGTACADFVIFPPRWQVQENTFRPPYYHRNLMSEYMGLIRGAYEAKEGGFVPGGGSLHSCMAAHGPDKAAFDKHSNLPKLEPFKLPDTMAFMFESTYIFKITDHAKNNFVDKDYHKCWEGLESHFKPT